MTSITSVGITQPLSVENNNDLVSKTDTPIMAQTLDAEILRGPTAEMEDTTRGRRKSRARPSNKGVADASPTNAAEGHSSGTDGPSRKRRRSRKGLDKKFQCPQENCGKSYSRAEHL